MTIDGRLLIAGHRVAGEGGLLTSKSPATLEAVGEAHLASSAQCRDAVAAAKAAFPGWRDTPAEERRRVLRAVGRILLRRAEEATRLLSLEKGSPLTESLGTEVQGSLAVLDYYGRFEPPPHVFFYRTQGRLGRDQTNRPGPVPRSLRIV